jgi:CubicO group peptidase (beta-lactamase class C family)
MSSAIDQVLQDAVAAGSVPQAVAIAADRDGNILYEGGAGPRSVGSDEPAGVDTHFRIASMTKMVATTAALQQVEQGNLELEAPIDTILPQFADLQVLEGFDGDTPKYRPAGARATVKQLITHTTGLSYWFWNPEIVEWERVTGTPNVLTGDKAIFTAPLIADPGTKFEYGINTDWLGEVVREVSGQNLKDYLAEHVLGPLGMNRTSFTPSEADRANLAAIHIKGEDGDWVATDVDWSTAPQWWAGGHGLYSTPRDYLRFQLMLLNNGTLDGEQILQASTVEQAFTNQIGSLDFPTHIPTGDPAVSGPWNGPPGMKWGHGLLLNTVQEPGLRAAYSGAWAGVFNSHYWVDPTSGVTGAIYSQFLPFIPAEAMQLYQDFEREVYRL